MVNREDRSHLLTVRQPRARHIPAWLKQAIFYQIYPQSFHDSNSDGIGDIPGVVQKLDYLQWLGVDTLWLSPTYPSPMADYGYDVADYTNVDRRFGTLDDFDGLLRDVHARQMKLLVDFVPNHTSDRHPWFVESRSAPDSPKRDWYIWRDARLGHETGGDAAASAGRRPPNNWLSNFGGSAWEWDDTTRQYYYHAFLKEQPDLNWRNPQVQEAMLDVFGKVMDVVTMAVGAIAGISLLVGATGILTMMWIAVGERTGEIGLVRALGATRGEIMGLFLGETLVISIIASVLGVGLGILFAGSIVGALGKIISQWYARTAVTGISVSWFYPVTGAASGIAASLMAAVFPVLAGSRISPISAIRSVPWSEEGLFTGRCLNIAAASFLLLSATVFCLYKFAEFLPCFRNKTFLFSSQIFLLLGVSLFTPALLKVFLSLFHRLPMVRLGSMGMLAGLNLRKNITRNAVAVAAIFFGISVFVNSAGFVYSLKKSVITWLDAVVRADIIVSAGHPSSSTNAQTIPMPVDMWKRIERVPGVLSADPWRKVYMDYNGRRVLLSVVDLVRRGEYSHFMVVRGSDREIRRQLPSRDTVVVSEPFAAQFGVRTGDIITLPTPSGAVRFGVVAVVVDYLYDGGTVYLDLHTFQRHWGDMLADQFSVKVKPGENISAVREAIQQRLGADRKLFVLPAREFKEEIGKVIDQTFMFNYALSIITMTIACFGIIITLLASVLERTREIGVLRSIGMLRGQVSGVVVLESVLMGVMGGILGSGAGIVTGWITLEGAGYSSLVEYCIPYGSIVWAMIMSVGLSALAGTYPARRAAKTNIVEALTYE